MRSFDHSLPKAGVYTPRKRRVRNWQARTAAEVHDGLQVIQSAPVYATVCLLAGLASFARLSACSRGLALAGVFCVMLGGVVLAAPLNFQLLPISVQALFPTLSDAASPALPDFTRASVPSDGHPTSLTTSNSSTSSSIFSLFAGSEQSSGSHDYGGNSSHSSGPAHTMESWNFEDDGYESSECGSDGDLVEDDDAAQSSELASIIFSAGLRHASMSETGSRHEPIPAEMQSHDHAHLAKKLEAGSTPPGALSVIEAVARGVLKASTTYCPSFQAAAYDHVMSLYNLDEQGDDSPPTSLQHSIFDDLEGEVRSIISKHGEDDTMTLRFKRPDGPLQAVAGNLLFFPPASSKDSDRQTLIYGPDTTYRMLAAGLSAKGLFTHDMYPFSTSVRVAVIGCRPFTSDKTFKHTDTACDLWKLLTEHSSNIYRERAVTPGLEVVWGNPVKKVYCAVTSDLPTWQSVQFDSFLDCPGVSNKYGSFVKGRQRFESQLFFRYTEGGLEFGKLVLFCVHPCQAGVIKAKGIKPIAQGWRQAILIDALVQLLYVVSRRSLPKPPVEQSTFAYVARPYPGTLDNEVTPAMIRTLRHEEKQRGFNFSRAELDQRNEQIMEYIEKWCILDENSSYSILAQSCKNHRAQSIRLAGLEGLSAIAHRGMATKGPEGRSAAMRKANDTRGAEGRSMARQKGIITMGPEGLAAAANAANITKGPQGRSAAAQKRAETMGHENLSMAARKAIETKGSAAHLATFEANRQSMTSQARSDARYSGLDTMGPTTVKAARQKGIETMGKQGMRDMGAQLRISRGTKSRVDLAQLDPVLVDEWRDHAEARHQTMRREKPGVYINPSKVKTVCITELREQLFRDAGKVPRNKDVINRHSYENWPQGLPTTHIKELTADEKDYLGTVLLAGILQLAEHSGDFSDEMLLEEGPEEDNSDSETELKMDVE